MIWGSMLFETLILIDFCEMFDKINDEKRVDFSMFVVLFVALFLTLVTLKHCFYLSKTNVFTKLHFSRWATKHVESTLNLT